MSQRLDLLKAITQQPTYDQAMLSIMKSFLKHYRGEATLETICAIAVEQAEQEAKPDA